MIINGEWSILKQDPVNAGYNAMVYDQTALGMDFRDCSNKRSRVLTSSSNTITEKQWQFASE